MTLQQAYETADRDHQAGRLAEAEAIYRQILSHEPDHAPALHRLGLLAHQCGHQDEALDLIRRAIALRPEAAEFYLNLGVVLDALGNTADSISAYRQAIALQPNLANAYCNLGNALRKNGEIAAAIEACRAAIEIAPEFAEAHNNLGSVLLASGDIDPAIDAFKEAASLRPGFFGATFNLGNALLRKGRIDEALEALDRTLAINPNFAPAHNSRGSALKAKGRPTDAALAFARAAQLQPDYAEPYYNLGILLSEANDQTQAIAAFEAAIRVRPDFAIAYNDLANSFSASGRLRDAIAAFRKAIELGPDWPEVHVKLADLYHQLGDLSQAIEECNRALKLRPDYPQAYNILANVHLDMDEGEKAVVAYRKAIELRPDFAEAYNNLGNAYYCLSDMESAADAFQKALQLRPNYSNALSNFAAVHKATGNIQQAIDLYDRALELSPNDSDILSNRIYAMHFHPAFDMPAICAELRRWNKLHAIPLAKSIQPHGNDRSPGRRLRIGYVSPDFREHVVGWNLLPLLSNHDRDNFEIFCYSSVTRPDSMTEKLQAHADVWRNLLGIGDEPAGKIIREDGIDILVDLSLHSARNRLLLFARKPAPIQLTYLGYCGSTGVQAIDYRFSDPYLDPPELLEPYAEKTIRLPNNYWCYQPGGTSPDVNALPALSSGQITFGCLNNFAKVSDPALQLWAKILGALPGSKLLLHAPLGSHRNRVLEIIPENKIEFVGKQDYGDYLQSYQKIDIALDPFPYGGGITNCDAIWMGVPVVTLKGSTAVGRGGNSILNNLGLRELVAQTQDEYEKIAIGLAKDLKRLSTLRRDLRQKIKSSPLMDAAAFAKDVEQAYRQIWRAWTQSNSKYIKLLNRDLFFSSASAI
jgi:predicted O-linked N-acetylglucosamine transferase (SPINDLY family)